MEAKESSDYLFHFTSKYERLVGIMKEKFKPFFCIEDTSHLHPENEKLTIAYPIICFCDIPFKRQKKHKEKYGNYGIGLTKEWGIKNHLNQVTYSNPLSLNASAIRSITKTHKHHLEIFKYYKRNHLSFDNSKFEDTYHAYKNGISILIMNTKPYEGKLFNKETFTWSSQICRFYDEKEWRYTPLISHNSWSITLEDFRDKEAFINEINSKNIEIQQKEEYRLKFAVNDIRYIILECNNDKERFLADMADTYSKEDLMQIEKIIQYPKPQ